MRADQMFAYTRPDGIVGFGFTITPTPGIVHHSIAWPDKACERYTNATLVNNLIVRAAVKTPGVSAPATLKDSGETGELVEDPVGSIPIGSIPSPVVPIADKAPETPPVKVAANPTVTKIEDAAPAVVESHPTPTAASATVAPMATPSEPIAFPGSDAAEPVAEGAGTSVDVPLTAAEPVIEPTPDATTEPPAVTTKEPLENIVEAATMTTASTQSTYVGDLLEIPYQQAASAGVTTERTILHLIQKTPSASDKDVIRFLNEKGVQVTDKMVRDQRGEAIRLEAQRGL